MPMKALYAALAIILLLSMQQAQADPLKNASMRQRIGNYDFEIALEPAALVAPAPAKIMLRVAGVNGDDLVDVPVTFRIEMEGAELVRAGPVIVPFGHYTYDYAFEKPGRYVLYADLRDYAYSGETLTFTFFLNVAGPYDYLYTLLPAAGAAAAGVFLAAKMKKARHADRENPGPA